MIDYVFWATSKNILAVLTPLTEWDYMKYLCKKDGTYEEKRLILGLTVQARNRQRLKWKLDTFLRFPLYKDILFGILKLNLKSRPKHVISWANESKSQGCCKGRGHRGDRDPPPTPTLIYIHSKKKTVKKKEKGVEQWRKIT